MRFFCPDCWKGCGLEFEICPNCGLDVAAFYTVLYIGMNFIGRKREITAVIKTLKQNRNIVLAGRYGVGRSCLVKHVSELCSETWQFLFADFSKTVARSCNDMVNQLASGQRRLQRHRYMRLIHAKDLIIRREISADLLTLHNLKRAETAAFFRKVSQKKRLGWSEHFIQMLAASAGGYALLIQEIAQREAGLALNGKNMSKTGWNLNPKEQE